MAKPTSQNGKSLVELADVGLDHTSEKFQCADTLEQYRICPEAVNAEPVESQVLCDSPIFNVSSCTSSLQDELRAPNVKDGDIPNIVSVCNGGEKWTPTHSNPLGEVVPPGCIRIAEFNGRMYAVGTGRFVLKQRFKWTGYARWAQQAPKAVNLTSRNTVVCGNLTICRVGPDEIGLAFEHATQAVLLAPGLHVYNSPTFKFVRTVNVQENFFEHGTFHVLRVKRGCYGLVWESPTQPRILREGNYALTSPSFKFEKFVKMEETYVKHGTIHIIQVPKGHVAKVRENVTPKLLPVGVHILDHPNFHFEGLENLASPLVQHGTITRFRVSQGEIGLATWHNEAIFVDVPGTYQIDGPDFIYHKAESVSNKLLQNGNKKVVTVFSGEVGLSYRAGCLDVLEPGRHIISAADHYFDCFLSTQQVTLRLQDTADSSHKEDLIIAETRDFVKVGICADIFYSIADASKTIVRVGKEGVQHLVMEAAIGTLTNIIRSTDLGEIAQSQHANDSPSLVQSVEQCQSAQAMGQPSAPLFFDKAHDEFLARLHDDFLERYGIEVTNIRMASFKIMDTELSVSISRQALVTAQTQNQLANLKGQTEIATAEQERQARVAQIAAEQDARALSVHTESQNKAQLEKAEAQAKSQAFIVNQQAQALIAQARAEAEAIRLKAEAEAEAIRTKAKAEAERAELLSKTTFGSQLALLELWSATVERSNEGVSKVVYCDPSVQLAAGGGNPLGLLGLNSLQSELSKLANIGRDAAP
jgi:regulator of protease activity HflC (stomatin/prohibitin superfamily)